jgi:tRNA(adenine34) deaminase
LPGDEPPAKGYELPDSPVQQKLDADWTAADHLYMQRALALAARAEADGEVPVGALVVQDESIVGEGWNQPIACADPTAHAEIMALRQAAAQRQNYRLAGATLYVTLEPCAMCAGAIVIARIERLVFAARDLRFGAVRSQFRLADSELLSHRVRVEEGLLAADAGAMLARFFGERRGHHNFSK